MTTTTAPALITKLAQLKELMAAGDFRGAISLAAKFPNLGAHRDAILDAHGAYVNPDFQRQIGKDPGALIAAGIAALGARYPDRAPRAPSIDPDLYVQMIDALREVARCGNAGAKLSRPASDKVRAVLDLIGDAS